MILKKILIYLEKKYLQLILKSKKLRSLLLQIKYNLKKKLQSLLIRSKSIDFLNLHNFKQKFRPILTKYIKKSIKKKRYLLFKQSYRFKRLKQFHIKRLKYLKKKKPFFKNQQNKKYKKIRPTILFFKRPNLNV